MITIALILSIQMVEVGWSQQAAQAPNFAGSYIVAISDSDFLASTYNASGNSLVVAVYDYFTPKPEGGIDFWRVIQKPRLELQRTGYVIDVDRGVHQVLVAR